MSSDFTIDADKIPDISQNEYYKRLQQQLKERSTSSGTGGQGQGHNHVETSDQKVTEASEVTDAQQARKLFQTEDKVELRSTKWKKTSAGGMELHHSGDTSFPTAVDMGSDAKGILRIMGHKIDYNSKIDQLQESYMQSVVQSRSGNNLFLMKYAQFKAGMFGQLLSLLGVSQEEIQKLQKMALKGAEDENIKLMAENTYNIELTELIHGNSKKVKKNLAMFRIIEKNLMEQMAYLGKQDYWNKRRLMEERINQLQVIREEFVRERDMLMYQYQYAAQETYGAAGSTNAG